jgi:hypothetical protein
MNTIIEKITEFKTIKEALLMAVREKEKVATASIENVEIKCGNVEICYTLSKDPNTLRYTTITLSNFESNINSLIKGK